jgi:hypothetical protein
MFRVALAVVAVRTAGAADKEDAVMCDSPIRVKDNKDDAKTNDLLATMGNKTPEKEVMELVEGMCPGKVDINGTEPIQLINTVWNLGGDHAGKVKVEEGAVASYMSGRTYFAEACKSGVYNHNEYVALNLLGKAFEYTVDLTGAGCGCNAALYMTNLRQNGNVSECEDYYCDANNVCGVSCAEVDIMEANQHAWHSTLHTATDRDGAAVGYGGGGPGWNGPRDWVEKDYGVGGRCIDTEKPFRVSVSFPVDAHGVLKAMDVNLTQEGKPCPMQLTLNKYEGMKQMTEALEAGMTPIISYWAADDMTWMDGAGDDMQGPCIKDKAKSCGEKVLMYDFAIKSLKKSYKSPVVKKPTTTTPPPDVAKKIKDQLAKELAAQQKEQAGNSDDGEQATWDQSQQDDKDWKQDDKDWNQDDKDWNQQDQQNSDGSWNQQGPDGSDDGWGEPWASWDHSTPKPGQVWDGAGRPVEEDGKTATTTTPCKDDDMDPVHCRPKLPGDPTRGGLKKDADVDYLFKKNSALGPILRGSANMVPAIAAAGAGALLAVLVALAAWRRSRSRSETPEPAASLVDTAPNRRPLRLAPSSQSLLTLGNEAV